MTLKPISPERVKAVAAGAHPKIQQRLGLIALEEPFLGRARASVEAAALSVALEPPRDPAEAALKDDAIRVLATVDSGDHGKGTYLSLLRAGICPVESIDSFLELQFALSGTPKDGSEPGGDALRGALAGAPACLRDRFIEMSLESSLVTPHERFEAACLSEIISPAEDGSAPSVISMLSAVGIKNLAPLFRRLFDIRSEFERCADSAISKISALIGAQQGLLSLGKAPGEPSREAGRGSETGECSARNSEVRGILDTGGSGMHPGAARDSQAPGQETVDDETVLECAQSLVEEAELEEPSDIEVLDPEVFGYLEERGLMGRIAFHVRSTDSPEDIEDPEERRKVTRLPVPEDTEPEALRKMDIRGRSLSPLLMEKLICLECFRAGTAKALIDQAYAPAPSLRSNMLRRIRGDKEHQKLFRKCWDRMVSAGAINRKKHGDTASLCSSTKEITDAEVSEALQWALGYHREIHARTSHSPGAAMKNGNGSSR